MSIGTRPADAPPTMAGRAAPAPVPRGHVAPGLAVARTVLALVAALAIVTLLLVSAARLRHPYELEWIEGAMLDQVARVAGGEALYVAPSLRFVPLIYPPLYTYVAAIPSAMTGASFFWLRLVSCLATLGTLGLLFRFASRETDSALHGLVAAGAYAACYRVCGSWYDLARIDSLMVLLLLAALYLARFHATPGGAALASAALVAAFLTKQTALGLGIPLAIVIAMRGRRPLGAFLAVAAAGAAAFLLLDAAHDGWLRFYLITVPSRHRLVPTMLAQAAGRDLLPFLPVALAAAAIHPWRRLRRDRAGAAFHALTTGALLATALLSSAKVGGYLNLLMPACIGLSLQLPLALHELADRPGARRRVAAAAHVLVAAQLLWLARDPRSDLPTPGDRAAGERLLAVVRSIPGDVYLPYHGGYALMAGKRAWAHHVAVHDMLAGDDGGPVARAFGLELLPALEARPFRAVILDDGVTGHWLERLLVRSYREDRDVRPDPGELWPRAGIMVRPATLWVPREATAAP